MKYLLNRGDFCAQNEQAIHWKESIVGTTIKGLWNFSWWVAGKINEDIKSAMLDGVAAEWSGVYYQACEDAMKKMKGVKRNKDGEPEALTVEDVKEVEKAVAVIKTFKTLIPLIAQFEAAYRNSPTAAAPAAAAASTPAAATPSANVPSAAAPAAAVASVGTSAPIVNPSAVTGQSGKKVAISRAVLNQLNSKLGTVTKYNKFNNATKRLEQAKKTHDLDVHNVSHKVEYDKAVVQKDTAAQEYKQAMAQFRTEYNDEIKRLLNEGFVFEDAADVPAQETFMSVEDALKAYNDKAAPLDPYHIFNLEKNKSLSQQESIVSFIKFIDELSDLELPKKASAEVPSANEALRPDSWGDDDDDDEAQPEAQDADEAGETDEEHADGEEPQPNNDLSVGRASDLYDVIEKHNGEEDGKYVKTLSSLTDQVLDELQGWIDNNYDNIDDTKVPTEAQPTQAQLVAPANEHLKLPRFVEFVNEGGIRLMNKGPLTGAAQALKKGVRNSDSFIAQLLSKESELRNSFDRSDEFKKAATALVNIKRLKYLRYKASIFYSNKEAKPNEHGYQLETKDKRIINPNLKIIWDKKFLKLDDVWQYYIDVDAINSKVKEGELDPTSKAKAVNENDIYEDAKRMGITDFVRKTAGYDKLTVFSFGMTNSKGKGYSVMRKLGDARHHGTQFHWYKVFGMYRLDEASGKAVASNMFGPEFTQECRKNNFVYMAFTTASSAAGSKPMYIYNKDGKMLMNEPRDMKDQDVQDTIEAAKAQKPNTTDTFRKLMDDSDLGGNWRHAVVTMRGVFDSDKVGPMYGIDLSDTKYQEQTGYVAAKDNHSELVKVFESLLNISAVAKSAPAPAAPAPATPATPANPPTTT